MKRIEPYWYLIILFVVVAAVLFVAHLVTGVTPDRVAFSIFGFDVYWYGIWIISGIAVGTFVVSRLALERAEAAFAASVSPETQAELLTDTTLPDDLVTELEEQGITTLGELLWPWGLDPRRLGLKKPEQERVTEALADVPGVDPAWIEDGTPWRPWNPDHAWNGLILVLILGVIGARIYHILTPSPSMQAVGIYSVLDYLRNPFQLINIRSGGLGIIGGILGGLLGLIIYTWRNKLPALSWADLAVVGMAIGQSIGRWGNYFNQELYGKPTEVPWAITIDPVHRLPSVAEFSTFHPAFLYESIWSLLTFFLLLWLVRKQAYRMLSGEVMVVYLVAYAIGRTLLELVRLDSRPVNLLGVQSTVAVATVVALGIAGAAVLWAVARRVRRRQEPDPPAGGDLTRQVNAG